MKYIYRKHTGRGDIDSFVVEAYYAEQCQKG